MGKQLALIAGERARPLTPSLAGPAELPLPPQLAPAQQHQQHQHQHQPGLAAHQGWRAWMCCPRGSLDCWRSWPKVGLSLVVVGLRVWWGCLILMPMCLLADRQALNSCTLVQPRRRGHLAAVQKPGQ